MTLATSSIGCPQIVHADKGTENVKVAFLQPFLRHQSTGIHSDSSFIYGRSVNNRVISLAIRSNLELYCNVGN